MDLKKRQSELNNITLLGTITNIVLTLFKGFLGWVTGSVALMADAFHSLSDFFTDIIVFAGTVWGAKPADKSHPYGHGKIETMSTIIIAFIIIVAGLFLIIESVNKFGKIMTYENSKWIIMGMALFSVVAKEWLYQKTMKVAEKTSSTALVANAWHHRSDALSSIAVLLGAIAMAFGWPYGDQGAGIVVGLMVSYAGLKIIVKAVNELGESAVDDKTRSRIENLVKEQRGIVSFHRLRTRRSGHTILMDIHILVAPDLSVVESHNISKKLEKSMQKGMSCPVDVTVHVEPDIPEEQ